MPIHLYCLLPAESEVTPPANVRAVIAAPGVVAWLTDAVAPRLSRDAREAASATIEHDGVIGVCVAQGVTPIPGLLADPYTDEAAAMTDVSSHAVEIRAALQHVRGKVEMTAIIAVTDHAPETNAAGSGRMYLEQLRSQPDRASALADRLTSAVGDIAGEPRRRSSGGRVALSHLLDRTAIDAYRAAALSVAGTGYRIVIDGPRAPYSFAAFSPRHGMLRPQPAAA